MKAAIAFLAACALHGQSFDEAAIKFAAPDGSFSVGMSGGPGTSEPGHFVVRNMPLRTIIMRAYDVPDFRFDGPSWLGTERFNIEAKVPAAATREQFPVMLRNLLAERFGVAVHEEERLAPAFALVIDKGGLKMKESTATTGTDGVRVGSPSIGNDGIVNIPPGQKGFWVNFTGGRFVMQGRQERSADLASSLSQQLEEPVIDETGLTARYDFRLEFAPPDAQGDDSDQSIFSAVKGLGLRLEPRRVPAKMIVVDHAEKTPTAN